MQRNAVLMITAIVIFFVAVLLINLLGIHRHSKRQTVVGILCVIIGTSMYVSPLTIMVRKNSKKFWIFASRFQNIEEQESQYVNGMSFTYELTLLLLKI